MGGAFFQHDATGTAATGAIAMLAVYAAALIFVLQHVAERYSPSLYPVVARQSRRWLITLALLVVLTAILILAPESVPVEIGAVAFLLASVGVALWGACWTWQLAASGQSIVDLVHKLSSGERTAAAIDVLRGAVIRGDIPTTASALGVFKAGSAQQAHILDWLAQQRQLLDAEWVTTEVMRSIRGGLAGEGAERLRDPIAALLDDALNDESYRRAQDVVNGVMAELRATNPFLDPQAALAFQCGFTIWQRGQEGASEPRRPDQPCRFADLQDLYIGDLKRLWDSVLARDDPRQVTIFCPVVSRLEESGIDVVSRSSIVYSILKDGGGAGLLEKDGLEELAAAIGAARHIPTEAGQLMNDDYLDSLAELVGLWVAELGHPDQVGRVLGNAGVRSSGRRPERLATDRAFTPESEAAVACTFGVRVR